VLCAGGRKSPVSPWLLKNRMSELFTSGSVGGAASNRRSYPAADLAFPQLSIILNTTPPP
jgi:hypothetical protein